jgi:hypothetical protein
MDDKQRIAELEDELRAFKRVNEELVKAVNSGKPNGRSQQENPPMPHLDSLRYQK